MATKAVGAAAMTKQCVYRLGGRVSDGGEGMKELLGGKGANLAEIARRTGRVALGA